MNESVDIQEPETYTTQILKKLKELEKPTESYNTKQFEEQFKEFEEQFKEYEDPFKELLYDISIALLNKLELEPNSKSTLAKNLVTLFCLKFTKNDIIRDILLKLNVDITNIVLPKIDSIYLLDLYSNIVNTLPKDEDVRGHIKFRCNQLLNVLNETLLDKTLLNETLLDLISNVMKFLPKMYNFQTDIDKNLDDLNSIITSYGLNEIPNPDHIPQDPAHIPQDPDHIPQDPAHIPQDPDHITQDSAHITPETYVKNLDEFLNFMVYKELISDHYKTLVKPLVVNAPSKVTLSSIDNTNTNVLVDEEGAPLTSDGNIAITEKNNNDVMDMLKITTTVLTAIYTSLATNELILQKFTKPKFTFRYERVYTSAEEIQLEYYTDLSFHLRQLYSFWADKSINEQIDNIIQKLTPDSFGYGVIPFSGIRNNNGVPLSTFPLDKDPVLNATRLPINAIICAIWVPLSLITYGKNQIDKFIRNTLTSYKRHVDRLFHYAINTGILDPKNADIKKMDTILSNHFTKNKTQPQLDQLKLTNSYYRYVDSIPKGYNLKSLSYDNWLTRFKPKSGQFNKPNSGGQRASTRRASTQRASTQRASTRRASTQRASTQRASARTKCHANQTLNCKKSHTKRKLKRKIGSTRKH